MANIDEKKLESENKHVENVESEALSPDFEQEILSYAPRLRGRSLTMMLAFVAGTGFTLFGCVPMIYLQMLGHRATEPLCIGTIRVS